MGKKLQTRIIDTNLIIRYLTNDDPRKADAIEKLLKEAKRGELEIPDVIIAEIVWVLISYYNLTKEEVIEKLEGLLMVQSLKFNRLLLKKTIELFRKYKISYTDAYLIAYSQTNSNGKIYSYDQGLSQVKKVTKIEP